MAISCWTSKETYLKRIDAFGLSAWCVAIAALIASSAATVAKAADQPRVQAQAIKEPTTVLAMIRLESDVMAQRLAQKQRVARRTAPSASLVSIFGLEPSLQATVRVGDRDVVFLQGHRQPITPSPGSMRLNYIKPPCVSFTRAGQSQTVCLKQVGS